MCHYRKFGFCKFQGQCKRIHLNEVCDDLKDCKDVKKCEKRHPKRCNKYKSQEICRFGEDCAYSHQAEKQEEEQIKLKEKIDILENIVAASTSKLEKLEKLENVVKALSRKVLKLENEIQEERKNNKSRGDIKKQDLSTTSVKEKVIENENMFMNKSSFDCDDIKLATSTPKKSEDKDEKSETKKEVFCCTLCKYQCKN